VEGNWGAGQVLTAAAKAKRGRLRQAEDLRKAQELKHILRPRGPSRGELGGAE